MTSDVRLGIVVVYFVAEDDEYLLRLHLERIHRHTSVPYRIYGAANRLAPELRELLAAAPGVEIQACRGTDLRRGPENAFYLKQLIAAALADGVTHLAIFHVDSFPIRDGWFEALAPRLSERRPVAANRRDENDDFKPMGAFMLWSSAFQRAHRPALRVSEHDRETADYRAYRVV